MSTLQDLLRQLRKDEKYAGLADELKREFDALADRRSFGLNFERHVPEAVELAGRKVRKGDKVRVLPPRGEKASAGDDRIWKVTHIEKVDGVRVASLADPNTGTEERPLVTSEAPVDDLVVVSEFRDPIYPGLVSTGKVERGGDKPFHTVINAENFHALQALLFTHRGKVDCIYIDPPYNTGAKDWKYDNDYVEGDDVYRHSKWLAMMERRLLLAKDLLNPDDSVLIVTIDEKEVHRLGILLEQVFAGRDVQMVTVATNKKGSSRPNRFSRSEEYLFFIFGGASTVHHWTDNMLTDVKAGAKAIWNSLLRRGDDARRLDRPNMFFPVWVRSGSDSIAAVGDPLPPQADRTSVTAPADGLIAAWPLRSDGSEGRWQVGAPRLRELAAAGMAKAGAWNVAYDQPAILFLKAGQIAEIEKGALHADRPDADGPLVLQWANNDRGTQAPRTIWSRDSHDASIYGSTLLRSLIPGRKFPFPKALYAVEDALRFVLHRKHDALIVDFFSGSGTTAHAVMRLNKQDGGRRQAILVTNNEVSADEQKDLRKKGLRPGDPEWEALGICDFITKPRIRAAITGLTPDGEPIKGDYKFTDEFPMADGFEENAEFFTLTYESPLRVRSNLEFARIAPLLWMRAGSRGRRIDALPNGWDVADAYGVIADLDEASEFVAALAANAEATHAFIVTDEDRLFETLVAELPDGVEPVRLYDAYLRNFEIEAGRLAR